MNVKFCSNCYNFEDRRDTEGYALCGRIHRPGVGCEDFIAREIKLKRVGKKEIESIERFCWNCQNFEDRRDLDGSLVCAKGHSIEGNCDDFIDKNQKLRAYARGGQ